MSALFADFYSLRRDVEMTSQRVEETRESAGLQLLEQELADLELKAADSSLWNNQAKAQEILLTLTDVKDKIKILNDLKTQVRFNSFIRFQHFFWDLFSIFVVLLSLFIVISSFI